MTLHWQSYWQVCCAPWRQRKTEKDYFGLVAIVVLLLPFVALLVFLWGRATGKELMVGSGMIGLVVVTVLWAAQISGLLHHNHPVPVRLVPGYLQAQRRVLLAVWLVLAGLQAPAVWVLLGALPAALLPAGLRSPFMALVFSATELMLIAIAIRWVWFAAFSMILGSWLSPILSRLPDFDTSVQQAALAHAHWIGVVLLAAFAWLLTHGVLRNGSAAHRAAHTARAKLRVLWRLDNTQKKPAFMTPNSWVNPWLLPFSYPYLWYTQRLLKAAQPTPRSVMARVYLCLAAQNHWSRQLPLTLGLIAVAAVVGVSTPLGWAFWLNSGAVGGIMVGAAVIPLIGFRDSMLRSRREHGLLVLLPRMPHAAALNRAIAVRHLRQTGINWAILLLVILVFPWSAAGRSIALLIWLAYLPVLPFAIQDWATVNVLTPGQAVLRGGKLSVGLPIVAAAHYWLGIPWQGIAPPVFALCAGILVWRWRKLSGYPQALPAGRLAP